MLDFSWSHILIVLIVALVVVGPKDLPRLMRVIGQWMGKARRMAGAFRKSFDDMARQSELDELRKEIGNLRAERPLAGLERDMHQKVAPDEKKPKSAAPQRSETAPRESMAATDGYKPPAP
jgi:sec-independent protein translocase protein TatB